ncbi:sodium:solute symporter family protein [Streptomyces sp. GMR22]|uniref:sodium:solute symporter family protein n=1 Tax=Streptomyces sp. GMR22 TaxID=2759524 RepID=UPI0015F7C488|nr:sodium:solute symporter family protein [Streptomyces sp. GMR22]MBA6440630.1 sodium:solute symporter family protein [Streptomyces sp. GMR22]
MALFLAFVIAVGSIVWGAVASARGRTMNMQEWSVGGRRFGTLLFWFLLVGETFTTSALLGASQGVFSNGAPGFFVLGTVVLNATVGYWMVPKIWRAGKRRGLVTMADYFTARFEAPWFGGLIAVFGIVVLLLYGQLQLTGLGLILGSLFGTGVPTVAYVVAGGVLVAAFVLVGGMRSAAYTAIVKDILLVVVLIVIAVGAAKAAGVHGLSGIFDGVKQAHPAAATLPGILGGAATNTWWWMSFLLLTPLGAFALPHVFQVSYSAKDVTTIRRNQVIQPLYSLFYVLIIVIAFAALLALPHLAADQANQSLLLFVQEKYPDWVIGVLGGVGILVALVPTAVLMLAASSLLSSNVIGAVSPRWSSSLPLTRVGVIVFTGLSVLLAATSNDQLLTVMTSVYSAVGQLAPALFLSMMWRRVTAQGLAAGAICGGLIVGVPDLGSTVLHLVPAGTVVGLPALIINLIVTVAVTLATAPPSDTAIDVGIEEGTPTDPRGTKEASLAG